MKQKEHAVSRGEWPARKACLKSKAGSNRLESRPDHQVGAVKQQSLGCQASQEKKAGTAGQSAGRERNKAQVPLMRIRKVQEEGGDGELVAEGNRGRRSGEPASEGK